MITIDKDLGIEWRDSGVWRSYRLTSNGECSDELLANATVEELDQDGGSLNCYGYEDASGEVATAVEKAIDHALGVEALKEAEPLFV